MPFLPALGIGFINTAMPHNFGITDMFANAYMNHRIRRRARNKQKTLTAFCRKNHFHTLHEMPVSQFHKHDTVFILGSGAIITELSPSQWELIRAHDSIGFNNWTMHPFVPTFYFFEPSTIRNEREQRISDILYRNSTKPSNT